MSSFEFLLSIAAVVIAIGMTEIVGGWGRLLRSGASIRVDWIHLLWSLNTIVLSVLYWMGMWPYGETEFVYVGEVYMLVLPTLLLVLTAYGLIPEVPADTTLDLREYYMSSRARVFIPFSAFLLAATAADLVIVGRAGLSIFGLLFVAAFVSMQLALVFTNSRWFHGFVACSFSAFLLLWSFDPLVDFIGFTN